MKVKILYVLFFLIELISCSDQKKNNKSFTGKIGNIEPNKTQISKDSILNSCNCDIIRSLIPRSDQEYLKFYSLTDRDPKKFEEMVKCINSYAFKDTCGILKLFLFMNQYVDGEFAESYYDDATYIIEHNKAKFCDLFTKYRRMELKNFSEEFNELCK